MGLGGSENCYDIGYRRKIISSNRGILKSTIYPCTFILYGSFFEDPITVNIKIRGVILLIYNTLVSQWMNKLDPNKHFIQDYIDDETFKIQFFHSGENLVKLLNENLSNGTIHLLTSG